MTAWVPTEYSNGEIDRAGLKLLDVSQLTVAEYQDSLRVLDDWRSSHAYPLLVFRRYLQKRAKEIEPDYIIAQRLKRKLSILSKLERSPSTRLSRMQDIGGCRVIFKDIKSVYRLRDTIVNSRRRHILKNQRDYIEQPKESGYRGIHLVYQYVSETTQQYRNILLEIQIRTHLQHLWATAVETSGSFISHSLKSSQGPAEWLRFFQLVSSLFALEEQKPTVPNTPNEKSVLITQINAMCKEYRFIDQLQAYNIAADRIIRSDGYYYVLVLDYEQKRVRIGAFAKDNIKEATDTYNAYENNASTSNYDVVLVSTDSIGDLKKAYPNYFMNMHEFIHKLNSLLQTK